MKNVKALKDEQLKQVNGGSDNVQFQVGEWIRGSVQFRTPITITSVEIMKEEMKIIGKTYNRFNARIYIYNPNWNTFRHIDGDITIGSAQTVPAPSWAAEVSE